MFLEYFLLELFLIPAAGISLLWGNKGIIASLFLLTILNYFSNYAKSFLIWEIIILLFGILGLAANIMLDKKTHHLRIIKVTAGSGASLLASALFLPLIPGVFLWSVLIGIPMAFSYREMPKALYHQIIFKFIFCTGWIIIGNILY